MQNERPGTSRGNNGYSSRYNEATSTVNIPKTENERIRAKSDKKQKKSKLRKKLMCLAICFLLLAIVVFVSGKFVFIAREIEVVGNTKYSADEIRMASGLTVGSDSLFFTNYENAGEQIERALPYIRSVEFQPELPDKLIITVTEQESVFTVKTSDNLYVLLDDNGKVLETGLLSSPKITILLGFEDCEFKIGHKITSDNEDVKEKWEAVQTLKQELTNAGIDGIVIYDLRSYPSIVMNYQGSEEQKYEIRFGKIENMQNKMALLKDAIEKESSVRQEGLIDFESIDGKVVVGDVTHETVTQAPVTDVNGNIVDTAGAAG